MVAFVATKAVDMGNLSELGLLAKFEKLSTPSVTGLSSFTATKGNVSLFITGKNMTAVLKEPVSGKLDGIVVSVKGQDKYSLQNLKQQFGDTEKTYKGNYEKKIFSGDDVITGSKFNDKLQGYAGNDQIQGRTGKDVISGGKGNDKINGNGDNDVISGDGGSDLLNGGGGKDTLTGGGGKDTFFFNSKLKKGNLDTITDFQHGKDTIQLDGSIFSGLGHGKKLAKSDFVLKNKYDGEEQVIVYDKKSGKLFYDGTGGNLKDAVAFAKVKAGLNLDNGDFYVV